MRISTFLLSITLVLFCVTQVMSQTVKEDFNYAVGQSIDNLGNSANGWGSPWRIDTSASHGFYPDTQMVTANTGLGYGDLDYQYSHIGNHVNVTIDGGANFSGGRYIRMLKNAWPDAKGAYWVSFMFEANKAPSTYTYYLVKLFSGSKELLAIGRGMGANFYSCGSGWIGSGGPDLSTTSVDANTPVFLVTKIVLSGDAADSSAKTYMWINPDPSSADLDTSTADVKRLTDMRTGFDRVSIGYGSQDTIQVAFDEVRLGTSYADVSSDIKEVTPPKPAGEDFNYTVGQSIDTVGTAANGWGGPWRLDTTTSHGFYPDTQMVTADTGLGYGDLDYQYYHTGNHVNVTINGGTAFSGGRYYRALENAWPDAKGAYWVSFLFEANKAPSTYTYYLVKLFSGTKELLAIGRGMGANFYSCGSGWIGSGGPDLSTTTVDANTPVFLVTKIVLSGDAADSSAKTYMWINPDPTSADLDTSTADVKRLTDMRSGFDRVALDYGSQDTIQVAFDEVRLGTSYSGVASILDAVKKIDVMPHAFELSQNYPNPFNPTTRINYAIPKSGFVTLKVYNILGQEVSVLFSGQRQAGNYSATFDGSKLASGIYLYRLEAGGTSITKKFVLMK